MKRNSIATRWTGEFILFLVRAINVYDVVFCLLQVAEIRKVRQILRQSVGVEGWNLGDAPGVAIVDSFRHEIGVQVLRRSARCRRVRTFNSHRAIPKYLITTQLTLTEHPQPQGRVRTVRGHNDVHHRGRRREDDEPDHRAQTRARAVSSS